MTDDRPQELAVRIPQVGFLELHTLEDGGWDWTLSNLGYKEIDGGVIETTFEIESALMEAAKLAEVSHMMPDAIPVDYETFVDRRDSRERLWAL